jgi:sucrose-6-phosphate hydrolase SacC (GH32 family)
MTFIGFDGKGYQSFVAESADLVHWKQRGLAMGYGPKDEFDHGGCVVGAYLYESYDLKAPRRLKRYQGKYWTLYGAYPRQGGYELRPGYEGVAWSDDGLHWKRAKDKYILSVFEPDRGEWEKDCIYQPWLVEHEGRFYDFYNAAGGHAEQTGIAFSTDLLNWSRYAGNPVLRNRRGGYDEQFCSDPKVFRDGDHWVMFYFGVGRGGAHIMVAFSRDLLHWTAHAEPLYKAGGNPSGLDKQYAHKISLVYDPANDTFLMFYNAVPGKRGTTGGRGIGLISSRPLASDGSPGAGGRSPFGRRCRREPRRAFSVAMNSRPVDRLPVWEWAARHLCLKRRFRFPIVRERWSEVLCGGCGEPPRKGGEIAMS